MDPGSGASLGLCRVVYRKNSKNFEAAIEATQRAIKTMNRNRLGGTVIHVEVDDDGSKCEAKFSEVLIEREEARALATFATKAQTPVAVPASSTAVVPRGPKAMQKTDPPSKDTLTAKEEREVKMYGRESSFRARDTSKISKSSSETTARIGNYAYIFVSSRILPLHKVTAQELQIHFSGKKNRDIFTDHYGFYVLFDNDQLAAHAHKTMDKSTFLGFRLYLELHKAKILPVARESKPLGGAFKKTFQPVEVLRDPILETTNRLVKELQEVFLRDIRSRVVGPALLEFLDPANFTPQEETKPSQDVKKVQSVEQKPDVVMENVHVENELREPKVKKLADVLMNIPRRKKNKAIAKVDGRMRISHRMDHHALYSDASEASDAESRDKRSDRPSSIAPSIEYEDDGDNTPMRKIKPKVKSRKLVQRKDLKAHSSEDESEIASVTEDPSKVLQDHPKLEKSLEAGTKHKTNGHHSPSVRRHAIDFTSSSEDEKPLRLRAKPTETELESIENELDLPEASTKEGSADEQMPDAVSIFMPDHDTAKKTAKVKKNSTKRRAPLEKKGKKTAASQVVTASAQAYESSIDQSSSEEEVLDPVHPVVSTTADEDEVVLDIDGIQSIVKDREDLYLLQQLMHDTSPANVKDIHLWAWQQKESKAAHADGVKGVTKQPKDTGYNRVHKTGSAKTEGWYPIPDIEKSLYLPNRNRAVVTEPGVSNTSSRMNRANNRRQAAGIEAQRQTLEAQTDLLRFNALKSRKKQLKFSRSAIHDWGLYALEPIERGEMVIEYVGEVIRQQVADHREKRYERQGIGSSYLFRIDEEFVIDATKSGNIARFINHSCDPSCTAKIITVYGQKKIVIYAQRDIALGEEITYDYKFPLEDEKIPCLCGSIICRKYLN